MTTAVRLIADLRLSPHPEGGHYRETLRLPAGDGGRSAMTAILFLLDCGEASHWHRVDADELWLWHAGSPLRLRCEGREDVLLGTKIAQGQQPQSLIPAGAWQAADACNGWALVSCVVTPGFDFAGFELAAPGWTPHGA